MNFIESYVEFGEKVVGICREAQEMARGNGWKYEFGTYYEGLGKFLAVYSKEMALKLEKIPLILCEGGERVKVNNWDYVSFSIERKNAIEEADEIVKDAGLEILDESEFGEYYEVVSVGITLRFYPKKIVAIIPKIRVEEAEKKLKELGLERICKLLKGAFWVFSFQP